MKKHLITLALFLLFCAPAIAYVTTSTSNPKVTNEGAITNPNAGVSGLKPGVNDTYYTHYKTITGYKSNGRWGFYSENGRINLPPMFTDIEGLNMNYIKVEANGVWGLIDSEGNEIIVPKYDDIEAMQNDLFKVEQ